MEIITNRLQAHEVLPYIQAFQESDENSFYYAESLHKLTLKSLSDYCEMIDFTYMRLFNKQSNVIIRKTRFGYEAVQYNFENQTFDKTRKIFIDSNCLKDAKWKTLIIAVYYSDEHGCIECWKGVE